MFDIIPDARRGKRAFIRIARPIYRQYSSSHVAMKRRVRPIAHSRYQAMFDRIVMNVIGAASKVRLATKRMLPISSLPECKLAVAVALDFEARIKQAAAEVALDPAPAPREIRVSFRESVGWVEPSRNPSPIRAAARWVSLRSTHPTNSRRHIKNRCDRPMNTCTAGAARLRPTSTPPSS